MSRQAFVMDIQKDEVIIADFMRKARRIAKLNVMVSDYNTVYFTGVGPQGGLITEHGLSLSLESMDRLCAAWLHYRQQQSAVQLGAMIP